MKNPLFRRLSRELKSDFGKYMVIFLFMTLSIGFISGFLVAGGSMKTTYDRSFEDYNIENGHFVVSKELGKEAKENIEKDGHITLFPDFYIEKDTVGKDGEEHKNTLRIFKDRKDVNKICVMYGKMPGEENEIAVDRMYADNNDLSVGDSIIVGTKTYQISALVALSDYSAMFSSPTDLMFDALKFGVAIVSDEEFEHLSDKVYYSYEWKYDKEPKDKEQEKKVSDKLVETVYKNVVLEQNNLSIYLPRYSNQAIQFTGNDMGGDRSMMLALLYILIAILGFIFAVTSSHTITKEAGVIGTLRASGYKKSELLKYYMAMPVIVSLISAILGNVLGYTAFKYIVVSMYYNSYSLPTYYTIWNGEAFVLTTIIPIILMIIINLCVLLNKLSLSPLKFLRHDLSRKNKKKAMKLPDLSFLKRFRIRVIFQNKWNYVVLFFGIAVANVLLMFGLMMTPLLDRYQDEIIDSMICKYQYILANQDAEVINSKAEKFYSTSLNYDNGYNGEELSLYGIEENSQYFKQRIKKEGFFLSKGFEEKYGYHVGDTFELKELYGKKTYQIKIDGFVDYPASLSVFMSKTFFEEKFSEETYAVGYFSNEKLDLKATDIALCIEKDDLTKTSRQLTKSMGGMFYLMSVFAIIMFALIIYLLTKLVIEKNANAISMVKILGYKNSEIGKLYIAATTIVVIFSILLTMFVSTKLIQVIYKIAMVEYSGWLTLRIVPEVYVKMLLLGMLAYAFVAYIQFNKIKKVPMDQALKNVE